MKIYVSHSRLFDFKSDLYEPLKNSGIDAEFIFPHKNSDEPFDSKRLFESKGCDLVLAEGSYQSTGQGIELGWANLLGIKIISMYKSGTRISNSQKMISETVIEYDNEADMIEKLKIKYDAQAFGA